MKIRKPPVTAKTVFGLRLQRKSVHHVFAPDSDRCNGVFITNDSLGGVVLTDDVIELLEYLVDAPSNPRKAVQLMLSRIRRGERL